MDEQQLAQLRAWADRLRREADSDELKAAGRALELATAEIERLRVELAARATPSEPPAPSPPEPRAPSRIRRRERRPADRAAEQPASAERTGERRPFDVEDEQAAAADPRSREHRPFDVEAELVDDGAALYAPEWDPPPGGARASNGSGSNGHAAAALLERHAVRTIVPGRAEPLPLPEAEGSKHGPPPRGRTTRQPFSLPGRGAFIAVAVLAALVGAWFAAVRLDAPDLDVAGPPADAKVGAVARDSLSFAASGSRGTLENTAWILDGQDITARVRRGGGRATFSGTSLPDGEHYLTVRADGRLPGSRTSHVWHFTVDTSAPAVILDAKTRKTPVEQPMTFGGRVEEGSTVLVNGRPATVDGRRFAVRLREPPRRPVDLVVTDTFGNTSARTVNVDLIPRTPRARVRAVHVTFHAWKNPALRRGVLALIDQGRINTVELDLKDESGEIGFDAPIPAGRQVGAVTKVYDLPAAIDVLHRRGAMVVGRIVAFRDPVYAAAAWNRGWRAQVVQTPDGQPYAGYGGFTNFANPAVRRYNIDVARVAAQAGIDDVLYDYARRPDGPRSSMRFPGLRGSPERSITTFMSEARRALKPYGTFLGISVFGVAATRPTEVAQDVRAIARNVDYVAPMVYPSHWGRGEYDVAHPNAQPYAIVRRSLADFRRQVRGTGARVVPWLQDFSLGIEYGPAEVCAQVRAARDAGIREWLLWDPNVSYSAGTCLPQAPRLGAISPKRAQPTS